MSGDAALTGEEVRRLGAGLAVLLVDELPAQRARMLRRCLARVPAAYRPQVMAATVAGLLDVVDGCREISPRAREWIRDELEQRPDPFRDLTGGTRP